MPTGLPTDLLRPDLLRPDLLRLNASPAGKEEAIREAAQLLIAAGCINPAYAASMLRREAVANTFLGHGVAIPHGMVEDRGMVRRSGIAVLQVPGGIAWNPGQTAHLVVAIAAQSDAHIAVLRRLPRRLREEWRLADRPVHRHRPRRPRRRPQRGRPRRCPHHAGQRSGGAVRLGGRLPHRPARPPGHRLGGDGAHVRRPHPGPPRRSGGRRQGAGGAAPARPARRR
ncbi:PTS sugar transporter subunit IIA [Azospirillum sp. Marseille-Q6669]